MITQGLRNYLPTIEKASNIHCIDSSVLMAIIWKETHGETWACRYEKSIFDRQMFHMPSNSARNLGISTLTEMTLQATSWGLMQILGVVAREEGYDGHLNKLGLPEFGVSWAAKHFSRLLIRYNNTNDAIAAWNAGNARDIDPHLPGTQYSNTDYVRAVNENIEMIKTEIRHG